MAIVLMLCLLAMFGGFWLFLGAIWLVFRIGFWILGGVLGFIMAGVGLLVMAVVGLALLPLAGLILLPFALPVLFLAGLVWLLTGPHYRPAPIIIRR